MKSVTGLSRRHLKDFLGFAERKLGYSPIVLGGWAVFAFTRIEQSVDADVLVKSQKDVEKLLPFFETAGFKPDKSNPKEPSFEKMLENPQELGGIKIESVIFDVMTAMEPNQMHANKNIEIPWKLSFQYNAIVSVDGVRMVVPSPELLLAYKVKALLDRTYDKFKFLEHMKHKRVWAARKDFKIEKDKRDIENLLRLGIVDPKKLGQLLEKTRFKKEYENAVSEIFQSAQ